MAAKKNVLLVIADDLGKSIGCYGDTTIRTPNLDRLAAEGTVFENAFASTASCSGSRSVIYTGLHTHQNGQYGLGHSTHHFMTFDHVETAPMLLRRLGYATGIVGKVHVGPSHVYPWEVRAESPTRDVSWVAKEADNFLRAAKEECRPFFLTVGYMDPHRDSTRGGFGNGDEGVSAPDAVYDPAKITVPSWINDIPEVRQELAEYYRSIGRVDRGFGLIMQALKEHGFDKDTLVIFTSDNGPPFLNSKTTLYDSGVRLPLIIRQPRGSSGIRNPNLISFVDILPTLLDWAADTSSLTASSARCGRSFFPILEKTSIDAAWTQVLGSHTFHEVTNYYLTRFLRTVSHGSIGGRSLEAYIRRPAEELYDMDKDPREVVNLADDPAYKDILLDLRKQLETWQRQTIDPWLFRDGVSLLEMQGHIDAGLRIPERFDFDLSAPAS